jgi:hypothetical protein
MLSPELHYYVENASNGAVLSNIEPDGTDTFDYFSYGAQKDYYILMTAQSSAAPIISAMPLRAIRAGMTPISRQLSILSPPQGNLCKHSFK